MAAAVSTETVTITVNDIELVVPKGELVVEAVKRLGLEIPIFCYHPRLKPVGMCRMCLVEVGFKQADGSIRKMPKPQAGCTLPVSEGMAVYTETDAVKRDRKGVLEFLLVNHPLDCPICDRGGECPLQNNTLAYGPSTSRFVEMKRHLPKAYPLSQYVTLDLERCIQCGRCVRFTEEISGDSQLAFRFRGASMQPSTFQLTDFESKFSGNVIEICPVGALTSAKYRFRARPWDLETSPGICTVTPCGTNIWFDHRAGKLVRINGRTNEDVNEEWTCDRTKFGHDFYNVSDRLTTPYQRDGDAFVAASWADASGAVLNAFKGKGAEVAVLVSAALSNESLFLTQKLARETFGTANIDFRPGRGAIWEDRLENKYGLDPVGGTIAGLEHCGSVLVFGASLADEQPMTFLRVRKAWFTHGARVVIAHDSPTEVDSFADVVLRYREGTAATVAAGLRQLLVRADGKFTPEFVEQATGVPADKLRAAAESLGDAGAVVTTRRLATAASEILAVTAHQTGRTFLCMSPKANSEGAAALGCLPDTLPGGAKAPVTGLDTRGVFEAAANGQVKALWLVGVDAFDLGDADLVTRALEAVETLVVSDFRPTKSAEFASWLLPLALPAEQDGTYTSSERRVQRMGAILAAPGEAKAQWQVAQEFGARSGADPVFSPADARQLIAAASTEFASLDAEKVQDGGALLPRRGQSPHDLEKLAQTLGGL
ncbi:MAG: NADH-quinone oxidoreductase subunit NuoG [Fimbriimonadaceae bacterium]|nr:NADH-quinone oxidoreductase subunit NuoG [Fimbriimonadaceae bacterium]